MKKTEIWAKHLSFLQNTLTILADKPEETPETTLKALWFKAAGTPKSVSAGAPLDVPELTKAQEQHLKTLLDSRLSGTPLAHITGRQQFMGLEMLANGHALVPRGETEILGQAALGILTDLAREKEEVTVIDVCTGSGNLAVTFAAFEPKARIFASDLSPEAISLAKENVKFHHLEDRVIIREGDLLTPFESDQFYNRVDLLTCNPPYISSAKVEDMPDEISRHEPRLAFDGGPFGIKILHQLLNQAPKFLRNGGWLAFEVGLGQGESLVARLKKKGNFKKLLHFHDDLGNIRAILAQT